MGFKGSSAACRSAGSWCASASKKEFYEVGLPRLRAVGRWCTRAAFMVAAGCAIAVIICGLIDR
jgi:hypothetical protein